MHARERPRAILNQELGKYRSTANDRRDLRLCKGYGRYGQTL